jgi:hypothetical protein
LGGRLFLEFFDGNPPGHGARFFARDAGRRARNASGFTT